MHKQLLRTSEGRRTARRRGLSLIELLLSLAISAMLLTATMVAIDASFRSYAIAAETASSQSGSRMITYRLLKLIRTSTAHGPLAAHATETVDVGGGVTINVTPATINGNTITSPDIELIDPQGNLVRIIYDSTRQQLWYLRTPPGGTMEAQPLVGGVTSATFINERRKNDAGLWVLERATIDYSIQPFTDQTIQMEGIAHSQAVRSIASTMPRRLE